MRGHPLKGTCQEKKLLRKQERALSLEVQCGCENGLRIGSSEQPSLFHRVLEKVSLELGRKKDQFRISLQTKVDNPLATIETFNREYQITKKEQEAVEWGWSKEGGDTVFNIVNAFTRGSQFEGLSAAESYRLRRTAGMILEMVQ